MTRLLQREREGGLCTEDGSRVAYVSVFLLAHFEAVAVVGVVVPGTTGVAAAGGAAEAGHLSYWGVLSAAVVGAFFGDAVSYAAGLWLHRWERVQPWLARHQESVDRAEHFVRRWGVLAVIIGRFLAPTRAFVPLIAGTTRMPIGRFMVANVAGAFAWAFVAVTLGEEALKVYERVPRRWSVVVLGVAVALVLLWILGHGALMRRRRRHPPAPREKEKAPAWHAQPAWAVAAAQKSDLAQGLTNDEAAARLARFGPNQLHVHKPDPWWEELIESLSEPLQLLLVAVGVVYFLLGEIADGVTILGVILAVAAAEVISELRAKRAVAALSSMAAPMAIVMRGGVPVEVHTKDLAPGDLVLLRPGERVPADLRLVECVALRVDESTFTGESVPVSKSCDAEIAQDAPLVERRTMVFASTRVTAGRGRGIVVATGRDTELGHVARVIEEAKEPPTPLSRVMRELSRWLVGFAIAFSVIVPVLGFFVAGRPVREMILTGLTLAFATIPEELPILIVMVLGIGAFRLAKKGAIVKRLQAAETLGCVSIVATDKTGTLTENRMRVARIITGEGEVSGARARRVLELAVLANDAEVAGDRAIGDPTETALIDAAREAGIDLASVRCAEITDERPFDEKRKRMSVVVEREGARTLAVKGAPESVLAIASSERGVSLDETTRAALRSSADALAEDGYRVLAVAERALDADEPGEERDVDVAGLVALADPVRAAASNTVKALKDASVRVLRLTGDHPATARAVASRAGIDASRVVTAAELDTFDDAALSRALERSSVLARVTPAQKLRVVGALQDDGSMVAVTGDGVNDAPALREASVGVAMGKTGTDVAREAADVVLADDDLATLEEAVRTGRVLFANLRKAVRYYLAAKLALVLASLAAVLLGLAVPFAPVQIIVLELFMDLGASVTFVAEPAEDDVMRRGPRDPRAPFMDRAMVLGIALSGISLAAAVLLAYLVAATTGDVVLAQTSAFVAWMIGHVVLAAHMRSERQPLLRRHPLANRSFLIWAASAALVLAVGLGVPLVRARLHLTTISPALWAVIAAAAVVLPSFWEPLKWLRRVRRSQPRSMRAPRERHA